MKTLTKLMIALVMGTLSFGQTILSSITLGAAVTSRTATAITLASTSTMLSQGPGNQYNTVLYVDREVMCVVTVTSSTVVQVRRGGGCVGTGAGARPQTHISGALVYFANTAAPNPAPSFFNNLQPTAEDTGSCTATSELVLPRIYTFSGDKYDCMGGQWVQVNAPGNPVLASATVTIPAGVFTPTGTIMITDTGTAAMTGINVPHGLSPGMCLTFIPGGAFTTTNATNIRIASTAVVGKALVECWDGTKWDPNY